MVKSNKSKNRKKRKGKGFKVHTARTRKINASTPYAPKIVKSLIVRQSKTSRYPQVGG